MRTPSSLFIEISKSIQNRRPSRNRISAVYKIRQDNIERHTISHNMGVPVNICTTKKVNPIVGEIVHPHKPDLKRAPKSFLRVYPVCIENKVLTTIAASRLNQILPDKIRKFGPQTLQDTLDCTPFDTNRQPFNTHREQE